MRRTELVYWTNTYMFELASAIVLECSVEEGKGHRVVTDRTIFHPQGGGQPSDIGEMRSPSTTFKVTQVRKDGDCVHHFGHFDPEGATFLPDTEVTMTVDEQARRLHARLHSAGHLLDTAVQRLGLQLTPGKGYHFPDSPFVEYEGTIPADQRDTVKEQLNDGMFYS